MKRKYTAILNLIDKFDQFSAASETEDLREFGHWLIRNKETGSTEPVETISAETTPHLGFYREMPQAKKFLTSLSRASRFIDFYMKKAFEDINIKSLIEFQFLISIQEMKNPRKTDVIYFNLVEVSTGVETIKRLVRRGFLEEIPDKDDGRTCRLKLAVDGRKALKEALSKFRLLDLLADGFGPKENWQGFIPSLLEFNDIHTNIYHHHRTKSFEELIDIIKSES